MTVGQLLRKARRKNKKLQRQIADEVGCSQVAVQGWESDKWLPENDRIRAVAAAYDVNPLDLLPKPKKKSKQKRRAA